MYDNATRTVQEQRAAAWTEMTEVLDGAEAAQRALTVEERKRWDIANSRLEKLSGDRDRFAAQEQLDAQARGAAVAPLPREQMNNGTRTAAAPGLFPPNVLAPEQRVATWAAAQTDRRDAGGDFTGFDLGKLLRGSYTGDWRDADLEKRAMSEGSAANGGYLVPTILAGEIIDLARAKTRVIQAGARTIPTKSLTEVVPRQVSDPTMSWRLENTQIAQSTPTFDTIQFQAKSLASIATVSVEVLQDANQDLDALVRNAIAKSTALELDRVSLYGAGTAQEPKGLKNVSTVPTNATSAGANGAPATWRTLADAAYAVRSRNYEPTGFIDNPRTEHLLAMQTDTTNRYLDPPTTIDGIPRYGTTQVPTTLTQGTSNVASDIFAGDWSNLWIGVRLELTIRLLVERYADFGQVGIWAMWRGDVQVAQPNAFQIVTGATPA